MNEPTDRMRQLLDDLDPRTRELVEAARELIHEVDPDVVEVAWPHQRTAGFGVGPKKMSEQYVYLDIYDQHLNLGFYYGADLSDPNGLLQGSGKSMRHIRIEKPEDLAGKEIRQLVDSARTHLPRLGR